MGSVTDKGSAFLYESCDNNFAHFAVGNRFARLRVDNFKIEVIVPVVHTLVVFAVDTDTGAVNLSKSVDIIKLDAEGISDMLTHFVAPSLRADNALFQVDVLLDASLFDLLSEKKCI